MTAFRPGLQGTPSLGDRHQILTCLMVTLIYKIGSEFPPSKKIVSKNINILANFRQLLNLIANISGTKQEIAERKTAFQTVISLAHAYLIWCSLVQKRRKIGP